MKPEGRLAKYSAEQHEQRAKELEAEATRLVARAASHRRWAIKAREQAMQQREANA